MAGRKSARGAKPLPAAAATATKSHKRQLSTTSTPITATPGSRASKRLRESVQSSGGIKATPTKTKYFETHGSEDSEEDETQDDDAENSGYEDNDDDISTAAASATSEEDDDDFDSEEDDKSKKRTKRAAHRGKAGAGATSGSTGTKALSQAKELWRPGVSTGLGPGKQVFIEKPKPRGDGGIKYDPKKIHPNTMEFLKDLKKNNDREWLKSEPQYSLSLSLSHTYHVMVCALLTRLHAN